MQEEHELPAPVQSQAIEAPQHPSEHLRFVEQMVCFGAVAAGVLTLTWIMIEILSLLQPTVFDNIIVEPLFAILGLIGRVTHRAYAHWQTIRHRHLPIRLFYSFLFGLTWPCWIRQRQ